MKQYSTPAQNYINIEVDNKRERVFWGEIYEFLFIESQHILLSDYSIPFAITFI